MKRLVSLLLVICMLVPCMAFAEQIDAGEDVFGEIPEELVQAPVEEDVVLPETDDLLLVPTVGVDGPEPYRELVLLQPTDLIGTAVDVDTVRLAWGPVAFATQYDVYRKLLGEAEYTRIDSTPSNQLYYEDTVTPGTVVYYRVQALNVAYDGDMPVTTYSPQSNTLPFITLEAPQLLDPRGMDADSLRLNWNSVPGATTYEVEIATSKGGLYSVARKDLTGKLCNIDGLTAEQGYYFRVRAVRTFSSGEKFYSEYSNVGCGTPMDRPSLTVTADGTNGVLNWSKSSGATGYIIYRKVGTGGSYSKLAKTGDVTTYVDAGLTPGEVYYYFVYAMRPVGSYNCFSLSSATRYFTIVEGAVLCAVENTGNQEQTINWTGPDGAAVCNGASKYQVFASTTMDGLYTMIGETTDTKFVATGLETGKTYFYKVRSVREFSNGDVSYGPWSNVMSMSEAGALQINSFSAMNATYKQICDANGSDDLVYSDVTGGYVGDVFNWSVNVSGGSGAYTFKWSLAPIGGGTPIVLRDFSEGYTTIPEGENSLTASYAMTLNADHIDLINNQKYAMQIEVMDSLGAVGVQNACEDTYVEMNFVAAQPTTKMVNQTLRVGETLELDHGVSTAAGDVVYIDVSNPTGAVSISGTTVTAVSNGYATILVTPGRNKNDVLIAYNITVGYATLAVNKITPSATTLNNYQPLSWDIDFTGGRPDYTINFKVYRDSTLVVDNTRTDSVSGALSVNYQPTVAGSYTLEVTITAADGQTVTQRSAVTKVVDYTPMTILPSTTSSVTGTAVTWVTAYSGSNEIIRRDYTLFRDGIVVATSVGTNEFAFTYTPTVAGSYVVQVIAYENNGSRIEVTSSTVTVVAGEATGSATGIVNGVRVALRKGPGTSYGIYFRIDTNETVTVIKEQDGWYYVDYKGSKGWMMARYITIQ